MGVEKNEVFMKAAISRAAHLWEHPLGELPVYKWPWKAKRPLMENCSNGKNALIMNCSRTGHKVFERFDQPFKQMNKLFEWIGNLLEQMNK